VGERMRIVGLAPGASFSRIVGVVESARHRELQQPRLDVYTPGAVVSTWVVKTAGKADALAAAARPAIRSLAGDQPVEVTSMEHLVSQAARPWRFMAAMLGTFGVIALLLAVSGIYGLSAYAVSARTPEFGVRMALGAARGDIMRLVFRGVAQIALVGFVAGIPGTLVAARAMRGLLFGIGALDPLAFAGAGLMLAAGVLVASAVPARRAAAVDPLVAIRSE
jgi:putative ABC transport system permease protein